MSEYRIRIEILGPTGSMEAIACPPSDSEALHHALDALIANATEWEAEAGVS